MEGSRATGAKRRIAGFDTGCAGIVLRAGGEINTQDAKCDKRIAPGDMGGGVLGMRGHGRMSTIAGARSRNRKRREIKRAAGMVGRIPPCTSAPTALPPA